MEQYNTDLAEVTPRSEDELVRYEGPNEKEIIIYKRSSGALLNIRFEGGGELPIDLDGSFTDINNAHKAVERYLRKKAKEQADKLWKEGEPARLKEAAEERKADRELKKIAADEFHKKEKADAKAAREEKKVA